MNNFFNKISRAGLILAAIGIFLLVVSVPDTLISFKTAKSFEDALYGDVEINAGDHVQGQVPYLFDHFAVEQTRTENKSNNSVTPWKTSRRYYVMPCGERFVGVSVGSSSLSVAEDLVDQTWGFLSGGADPTAELVLDCRVVEMDEELAEMFRDELRDYYDFTDQEIEDMGPLLMLEGRAFTTIRVFGGVGLGFVLLGLIVLVRRWTKVSKVYQQNQDMM